MNFIDTLHFLFQLLIVGAILRYIELMFPDSFIGEGLAVIY